VGALKGEHEGQGHNRAHHSGRDPESDRQVSHYDNLLSLLTPEDLAECVKCVKLLTAERAALVDLLREAGDTVQASLAETDISDQRRNYRTDLLMRIKKAIGK
jgi:hypothetical protein